MSFVKNTQPNRMRKASKRVLLGETREEEAARLEKEIASHPVTRWETGERSPSSSPGWSSKPFIPLSERTVAEGIAKKINAETLISLARRSPLASVDAIGPHAPVSLVEGAELDLNTGAQHVTAPTVVGQTVQARQGIGWNGRTQPLASERTGPLIDGSFEF